MTIIKSKRSGVTIANDILDILSSHFPIFEDVPPRSCTILGNINVSNASISQTMNLDPRDPQIMVSMVA